MNSLPFINDNNKPRGLFEPYIPTTPKDLIFPDWTPDFSERINIERESVGLALDILGITRAEYNSMNINELKELRRIDCDTKMIYATNILIYYKQNSTYNSTYNSSLPEISLIQHIPIKPKFSLFGEERINEISNIKTNSKIFPETYTEIN